MVSLTATPTLESLRQEFGKIPYHKDGNKIVVEEHTKVQQHKNVTVIIFMLLIPVAYILKDHRSVIMLPYIAIAVCIAAMIGAYGFDGRYIFNPETKEIIKEKTYFFFFHTKKRLAFFDEVNMVGVSCVYKRLQNAVLEGYELLIAYKKRPENPIILIDGLSINFSMGMIPLNKICSELHEMTNCEYYIPGYAQRSIKVARNQYNQVKYEYEIRKRVPTKTLFVCNL